MVNIYNKGGYKNPSIPKPSGGYSSLVKPATAPMRQGGLSQLAAKAAMQGRQPAAGNPPIPQTGRAPVAPPRAVESVPPGAAPPPTPRPQYGAVTPQVAPTVPPVQGGMLGAITQGLRAPQGQARGMVGAAAEAVGTQVPGWLTPGVAQGAGALPPQIPSWLTPEIARGLGGFGGASKPGDGDEGLIDDGSKPPAYGHAPGYDEDYSGYIDPQDAANARARDELIASGTAPMIADLIIQLTSGEYGYSDEEKAKMIAKGSGQQAEMMAARGLGASGLAGTGFGDIYSKVMSDAADLEASQTLQSQTLLADILGQQQTAEALSKEAADAKLMEWALSAPGEATSVSPDAYKQYQEWVDAGWSDADIRDAGYVTEGVWHLGPPPGEGAFPDDLFEKHPPPDKGDPSGEGLAGIGWMLYYQKLADEYNVSYEEAKERVQALLAIQEGGSAVAGFLEE